MYFCYVDLFFSCRITCVVFLSLSGSWSFLFSMPILSNSFFLWKIFTLSCSHEPFDFLFFQFKFHYRPLSSYSIFLNDVTLLSSLMSQCYYMTFLTYAITLNRYVENSYCYSICSKSTSWLHRFTNLMTRISSGTNIFQEFFFTEFKSGRRIAISDIKIC